MATYLAGVKGNRADYPRHHTFMWWAATHASASSTAPRFLTASVATEIGILLALSLMFPFMIHLLPVPDDARLGPRLLPMFYAPLLAALLGRKQSAIVVAVVAPWLNWALTSHPVPRMAGVMNLQLLVFVVALLVLLARVGPRWFLALPAYLACMLVTAGVGAVAPSLIGGRDALTWLLQTVTMGLPGVGVMVLINWLAVRHYPSGSDGHGPMTA